MICAVLAQNLDMAAAWVRLLKQGQMPARFVNNLDELKAQFRTGNINGILADLNSVTDYRDELEKFAEDHLVCLFMISETREQKYHPSPYVYIYERPVTDLTVSKIQSTIRRRAAAAAAETDKEVSPTYADDTKSTESKAVPKSSVTNVQPTTRNGQSQKYESQKPAAQTQPKRNVMALPPELVQKMLADNAAAAKQADETDDSFPPITKTGNVDAAVAAALAQKPVEIPIRRQPVDSEGRPIKMMITVKIYYVDPLFNFRLGRLRRLVIPWDEVKARMQRLCGKDLAFGEMNGFNPDSSLFDRINMLKEEDTPPPSKPTSPPSSRNNPPKEDTKPTRQEPPKNPLIIKYMDTGSS